MNQSRPEEFGMNCQSSTKQLRIIPENNGAPVNEYRVRNGNVEFRSLDAEGQPFRFSRWRVLTAEDLLLHTHLNTPVAQWLKFRLARRAEIETRKQSSRLKTGQPNVA